MEELEQNKSESQQLSEVKDFRLEWEKLEGETDRIFGVFVRFLDMGPTRSYAKLAELTGFTKQTVYNWSQKFHWRHRAECFDRSNYLEFKSVVISKFSSDMTNYVESNTSLVTVASRIMFSLIDHLELADEQKTDEWVKKRLKHIILICRAIREVQSMFKFLPFVKIEDLSFETILAQHLRNEVDGFPGLIEKDIVLSRIQKDVNGSDNVNVANNINVQNTPDLESPGVES